MKKLTLIILVVLTLLIISIPSFKSNQLIENNDINLIRGNNALFDEKYNLARHYYLEDLKTNPNRTKSLSNLATTFLKGDNQSIDESIKHYKKFIMQSDIDSIVSLDLIDEINLMGMTQELGYLKDHTTLAKFKAYAAHFLDHEDSLELLNAVKNNAKDVDYFEISAKINFAKENYARAVSDIDQAISLGNIHHRLFYLKSQALLRDNKIALMQKAVDAYKLVNSLYKETDTTLRLAITTQILENHPELYDNYSFKALYISQLLRKGELEKAKLELKKLDLYKFSSLNVVALLNAAFDSKAAEVINLLYNNQANEKPSTGEAVLYCQGLIGIVDLNEVVQYCKKATIKFTENAPLNFWYGIALLNAGEITQAQKQIIMALNYAPWVDTWRIDLANIYLSEGELELAIKVLDESIYKDNQMIKRFKLNNGLEYNGK